MKLLNLPVIIFLLFTSIVSAQSFDLDTRAFASGFNQPVGIENAGDSRLFIVEKNGTIAILNSDGSIEQDKFLDIDNLVNAEGERGLLGLAFHPDFNTNGFFYVNYTNNSGNTVISRFSVDSNNPNNALESSEDQLLTFNQPASNHNGGDMTFGPDGMLYIASGDGGGSGDPNNLAQNLNTLLGKILRLNVDISAPYIPSDNPFANDGDTNTRGEIWAFGLRNPFRMSFDSETNDFWIADVGQNAFEEVNRVSNNPAGLNYGWRCFEGNADFNMSGDCPDSQNPPTNLTFPLVDYAHTNGRASVTGGFVYRGTEFPSLNGIYIFADFISGELASIDANGNLSFFTPTTGSRFTAFGKSNTNVLYTTTISGDVLKIVDVNTLSSDDELFSSEIIVSPNPASNRIFVEMPSKDARLSIFNLKGQQLLETTVSNNAPIDISSLSSGLYLMVFENDQGISVKKLIAN